MDKSILAQCIDVVKDKHDEIPIHLFKNVLIIKFPYRISMTGNCVNLNICDTLHFINVLITYKLILTLF